MIRKQSHSTKVLYILYQKKTRNVGQCPMMVALPYIGGALCSTPQNLAVAHY